MSSNNTTIKVAVEISFSEEFMSNLLITAFDGSYGGCWYWAHPDPEHAPKGEAFEIDGDNWKGVYIVEQENAVDDEQPGRFFHVTHDVLAQGIRRLFDPGVLPRRNDLRGQFSKGEDCDYDAGDADVIVQLGVFGELVYG